MNNVPIVRVLVQDELNIIRVLTPGPPGAQGQPGPSGGGYADVAMATGGDDFSVIQGKLNQIATSGNLVSVLSLPDLNPYLISQPIVIPPAVEMQGRGSGQYPLSANITSPAFLDLPKTRLVPLPGFPAGQPMVKIAAKSTDAYAIQAARLRGVMLDCAAIAERGLDVISAKHCHIDDVLIFRPTSIGILEDNLVASHSGTAQAVGNGPSQIALQTTASIRDDLYNGFGIAITSGTGAGQSRTISDYDGINQIATVSAPWTTPPDATSAYTITGGAVTEGNNACQFNSFHRITMWLGSTGSARGWVQRGNPTNNINTCVYDEIKIVHADGDAIVMENADTNQWRSVDTFAFGQGYGCRLKGNHKNQTEYARNIQMFKTQFAGPGVGQGGIYVENGNLTRGSTVGARPSVFNFISGYSIGNAAPLPVIEDGAQLTYFTERFIYLSDPFDARFHTQKTGAYVNGAMASWRHLARLADGSEAEWGRIVARAVGAAGTEQLAWDIYTWDHATLAAIVRATFSLGLVMGAPAGGDKGQGTINAEAVYAAGHNLGGAQGVFTPQLLFGGGNAGMAGTFTGNYTQLGNKLAIHIAIILTAKGTSTGALTVAMGDLPYTSLLGSVLPVSMNNLNPALSISSPICIIPASSQTLLVYHMVNGVRISFSAADLTDTTTISIEGGFTI